MAQPRKRVDPDPLAAALRALRHRDRSAHELDERLAARDVTAEERGRALETLARVGYVDDARLARTRAAALAARDAGDSLIRHDLEQRGVARELVEEALAELEPEPERALRAAARRGGGAKSVRWLTSRGFGEESLEAVVAGGRADALG